MSGGHNRGSQIAGMWAICRHTKHLRALGTGWQRQPHSKPYGMISHALARATTQQTHSAHEPNNTSHSISIATTWLQHRSPVSISYRMAPKHQSMPCDTHHLRHHTHRHSTIHKLYDCCEYRALMSISYRMAPKLHQSYSKPCDTNCVRQHTHRHTATHALYH
jgi:hypothetical protein